MNRHIGNALAAAVIVIGTGIAATHAMAKDSLIDLDNARVGGFGGPIFKTSQIQNEQTFEIGGMGGATFTTNKHSIMIGGAGYGLVNELNWGADEKLEMGYGGFLFGYTYNPEALIHVDTTLLMGAGGVSVINSVADTSDNGTFLIAELASQVEINVTDFLEIGFGASYRMATDPSISSLDSGDLSKPGVFISFQFGSL
jgi:hypothetical protein